MPKIIKDVEVLDKVRSKYFRKYVVEVEFMHGDADHYQTESIAFKEDDKETLIKFLNFLERCADEYPYGRGGDDRYDHVEGYEEFVEDDYLGYWPSDDCGIQASFDGYEVFFYDEEGTKYYAKEV